MNEEQRIKVLEEELKVLKNELKTVLLDLREQYLNIQNPFNHSMLANAGSPQPGTNPENGNGTNNNKKTEPDYIDLEDEDDNEDTDIQFNQPVADIGIDDFSSSPALEDNSPDDQFASAGPQFAELETSAVSGPETDDDDDLPKSRAEARTESRQAPSSYNDNDDNDYDEDTTEESEPEIIKLKPASIKNGKKKALSLPTGNPKFDLVVIAGLTQWVDQATAKLGKERTEALVEMSCTMGRTPEHLKEVLIKMARLSPHESNGQPLKASDYLSILAQLENLLGESEIKDHALLSILSMMKESNDG